MSELTGPIVHNAIAAHVAVYQGIIADYERKILAMKLEIAQLRARLQIDDSRKEETGALPEQKSAAGVPRETQSRRDQRVNGQGVGRSEQGKEAPRSASSEEKQPRQVGEETSD